MKIRRSLAMIFFLFCKNGVWVSNKILGGNSTTLIFTTSRPTYFYQLSHYVHSTKAVAEYLRLFFLIFATLATIIAATVSTRVSSIANGFFPRCGNRTLRIASLLRTQRRYQWYLSYPTFLHPGMQFESSHWFQSTLT